MAARKTEKESIFSVFFKPAKRLNGCLKTQGCHAAGLEWERNDMGGVWASSRLTLLPSRRQNTELLDVNDTSSPAEKQPVPKPAGSQVPRGRRCGRTLAAQSASCKNIQKNECFCGNDTLKNVGLLKKLKT